MLQPTFERLYILSDNVEYVDKWSMVLAGTFENTITAPKTMQSHGFTRLDLFY